MANPPAKNMVEFRKALNDPRRGDEGIAWAEAVGGKQDAELALLRVAALARLPKWCPADGLDALGEAYELPRMPGQSDASYRTMLARALPIYAKGGSADAVKDALVAYGFTADVSSVRVIPVWQSPPAPVAPETSLTNYAAFYVVIIIWGPDYAPVAPLILGDWTLGEDDTSVLGSTMTRDQIVAVKRIVLRWKATHGFPIKLLLIFPATVGTIINLGFAMKHATRYPMGRTLGDTLAALGNDRCILGGYEI